MKILLLLLILLSCGKSELDGSGIISDPGSNTDTNTESDPTTTDTGDLEGKITDGQTGANLPGVTVSVAGKNVLTNGAGEYSITDLSIGSKAVSISLSGYVSQTPQVTILKDEVQQLNVSLLTAAYAANKLVIVTTWGSTPTDIDSHLLVPDTASSTFHLSYLAPGDSDGTLNSFPFAGLDVDDVDGNGPETISVEWDGSSLYYPRVYRFFAHNFSAEVPFKDSGAQVRVYRNGTLLQAFTVPATCGDDPNDRYWHVFDIAANSTITPTNACGAAAPANLY